ncbi:MAG: Gfo/Idh/MocA family oxidoreductase, partial [Pirellulales bacterium]|nr:Gfo/Idh/MocA family oxidoreductase [Pirellulales bacterium]
MSTRREFIKTTGKVTAGMALAQSVVPYVHAAEYNTINVALIGCGGRGTGAAAQALSVKQGPVKLVAMADIFPVRLENSAKRLEKMFAAKATVPKDHQFIGFDAYKKAMDCLKPGDVAIFATPPAFRWVHFTYAVEKGLNVFMEKPVTVDGPSTRRMLELDKKAKAKNLKVGVGLMVRHCRGRRELYDRIHSGEIGEIIAMRAYRMGGLAGACRRMPEGQNELLFQVRNFHEFLWSGGGLFNDFNIHQIDECSWMKDAWPVRAHALGGRHYRGDYVDQNLDTYGVEYVFPDGTRFSFDGRSMPGCHNEFASYAHGTKGCAIISTSVHYPGKVRTFKGHNFAKSDMIWAFPQPEPNPYQLEWDDLVDAIRNDKPYNEVKRGAEASLVTSMGRMAAHTGRIITFDQMLNCDHEFAPDVDKLTMDSPPPVKSDKD